MKSDVAPAISGSILYGRTVSRRLVVEAGDGIQTWRSKTCAILGEMGIVGVKYSGTMDKIMWFLRQRYETRGQRPEQNIGDPKKILTCAVWSKKNTAPV